MKNQSKLTVTTLAAALLLLPTSALFAQPPDEPGFGGPEFGRGFPGRGFMFARLAEELELSEAQKSEIEALRETHFSQVEPLMEEARTARQGVGELMRNDAFDEQSVRIAAQQAADLQVELTVLRARHMSELRSVLTPKQQEKAAELREEWQEGRRRFRDRPGRGSWDEEGPFGRGHGRGPRRR